MLNRFREDGRLPRLLLITHPDDELDPALAAELAAREGLDTVPAEHGLDALFKLAQGGIDVVVVVVRHPIQDGVVLANIVRERPAYTNLPIIAAVGAISCSDHRAMRLAGVDHVLPLPCSPTVARRCLDEALSAPVREPGLLERLARALDAASPTTTYQLTLLRY
jgi:CheY-like chemotaxis protein